MSKIIAMTADGQIREFWPHQYAAACEWLDPSSSYLPSRRDFDFADNTDNSDFRDCSQSVNWLSNLQVFC